MWVWDLLTSCDFIRLRSVVYVNMKPSANAVKFSLTEIANETFLRCFASKIIDQVEYPLATF